MSPLPALLENGEPGDFLLQHPSPPVFRTEHLNIPAKSMPRLELPIIVRLSLQELARALGRSAADSSVQRLGGLTVVLRASSARPTAQPAPDLVGMLAGPPSMLALAGAFRPVDPQLFRRLKANPALAKRFVLDPAATLQELRSTEEPCSGVGEVADEQQ